MKTPIGPCRQADGDDTHPGGDAFVVYGGMRQEVESRHSDAGLHPNIAAF